MQLQEAIQAYDRSDMLGKIRSFASQLREALELARAVSIPYSAEDIRNVVVAGMGGSAIGGDVVRCLTYEEIRVPVAVVRHYLLPRYVASDTLVFVSSYSGETEETLSAFRQAIEAKAKIVCISSGGTVASMAKEHGFPLVTIPEGYPPRSALGFLTVPVLETLARLKLISAIDDALTETIALAEELARRYGPDKSDSLAVRIAERLLGKIPVIYGSVVPTEAAALRWKGQISENGKMLAYANVFPELNHNEIVGWGLNRDLQHKLQVVYLRDRGDHERVVHRMNVTAEILRGQTNDIIEVQSEGESLMARLFSLILLGDFVSYYLALFNKVDPTPVDNITYLKNRLKQL